MGQQRESVVSGVEDIRKVCKGFECCHVMVHDLGPDKSSCGICPYKDAQTQEQIDLGGIECIAVLHDDARELLRKWIPKEMEREGGGSSWWYVCPECHGAIDRADRFCRHCGQAVV